MPENFEPEKGIDNETQSKEQVPKERELNFSPQQETDAIPLEEKEKKEEVIEGKEELSRMAKLEKIEAELANALGLEVMDIQSMELDLNLSSSISSYGIKGKKAEQLRDVIEALRRKREEIVVEQKQESPAKSIIKEINEI